MLPQGPRMCPACWHCNADCLGSHAAGSTGPATMHAANRSAHVCPNPRPCTSVAGRRASPGGSRSTTCNCGAAVAALDETACPGLRLQSCERALRCIDAMPDAMIACGPRAAAAAALSAPHALMQATRHSSRSGGVTLWHSSRSCASRPAMLQRLSTLSGGLRAVGGSRAALPALARQVRLYGFGSHVSDNGERLQCAGARCKPCPLYQLARNYSCLPSSVQTPR